VDIERRKNIVASFVEKSFAMLREPQVSLGITRRASAAAVALRHSRARKSRLSRFQRAASPMAEEKWSVAILARRIKEPSAPVGNEKIK
jgi:hypothetical protein